MTASMTHIAIAVSDIERSIAFYSEFCGLEICHDRGSGEGSRTVWMAEPGRQTELIFVLMSASLEARPRRRGDFSHIGFAVSSEAEVDAIAEKAKAAGRLVWPPVREPYPVGYYCGVEDPDHNTIEFSFGQPLGPGATDDGDP